MELHQFDKAIGAYRRAIELGYPDGQFNLASLLEQIGKVDEARGHWQAYLMLDPDSPWGRLAAQRLGDTGPRLR